MSAFGRVAEIAKSVQALSRFLQSPASARVPRSAEMPISEPPLKACRSGMSRRSFRRAPDPDDIVMKIHDLQEPRPNIRFLFLELRENATEDEIVNVVPVLK